MNKVKTFFCTADPALSALFIVCGAMVTWNAYTTPKFWLVMIGGVFITGGLFTIGFGLYHLIKWAQSHCGE